MTAQHGDRPATEHGPGAEPATGGKPKARDLNQLIRYTMWSVFRVSDRAAVDLASREALATEVADLFEQAAGKDLVTRGCYDLQGMRADADLMFWWIAPTADDLQEMYARFRRTRLGRACEPAWSAVALHRPAEFNKSHVPAFLAGEEPKNYVCVYPFVRDYEWYLLDDGERRAMLAEHGQMAREYPDVRANTVSAFALGDYEWMLAFEADELYRIVDLMRHLRGATARRHTRIEIPFYTGRRKAISELVASLA
jgi:peroxiredoxin